MTSDYCSVGMAMSMNMNGFRFHTNPTDFCYIFIFEHWILDTHSKYIGALFGTFFLVSNVTGNAFLGFMEIYVKSCNSGAWVPLYHVSFAAFQFDGFYFALHELGNFHWILPVNEKWIPAATTKRVLHIRLHRSHILLLSGTSDTTCYHHMSTLYSFHVVIVVFTAGEHVFEWGRQYWYTLVRNWTCIHTKWLYSFVTARHHQQMVLAYILMLIVMIFDFWLFMVIPLGIVRETSYHVLLDYMML